MKEILKVLLIVILVIEAGGCTKKTKEISDPNALKTLMTKIKTQPESANVTSRIIVAGPNVVTAADFHKPSPLVSLEDFFEGNKDRYSIGCGLIFHPGIPKFYEVLKSIRAKDNVQDVLIEIFEIDEQYDLWPNSEIVYIITSANQRDVKKWMRPLKPDEIFEGWSSKKPPSAAPPLKNGMKVYAAWWD